MLVVVNYDPFIKKMQKKKLLLFTLNLVKTPALITMQIEYR